MVNRRLFHKVILGLLAGLLLLVMACSGSDISQQDYDSIARQLDTKTAEMNTTVGQLDQLKVQLAGIAPSTVVQATEALAIPTVGAPSGWYTEAALAADIRLLADYDSSGPAAWDPVEHPLVFITSEGRGYAGTFSETYTKLAGIQIIDATTKEIVTSASYDLGFEVMGTPHGMGISPDGAYIYLPSGDGDQPWRVKPNGGRLLVVNAKTLKLEKVIGSPTGPHHVKAFTDWQGNDRVLVEAGGLRYLLDPKDDNKVVMQFGPLDFNASPYQSDPDATGKYIYSGLTLGGRGTAPELLGAVGKLDLETGRVTTITGVGMYPNGFAFTADGKYTYVSDSAGDRVYKIDNATNKAIANTQTGVPGPYNIALNWDETELWVVGKGEMTYNLGGSLGLVDTRTMRAVRDYNIGGQTIDHDILSPDLDANELWVTSSGTLEIIVFDLNTREVKARIPTANGGDTHSGGFVQYAPDFTGTLMSDQGGIMNAMREMVTAVIAAKQ